MDRKRIGIIAAATLLILAIPLVAMQFTSAVAWTASDFIIMGAMIFAAGILMDVAFRKAGKYRKVLVSGIAVIFLWLWAELAVGIFTTWGS